MVSCNNQSYKSYDVDFTPDNLAAYMDILKFYDQYTTELAGLEDARESLKGNRSALIANTKEQKWVRAKYDKVAAERAQMEKDFGLARPLEPTYFFRNVYDQVEKGKRDYVGTKSDFIRRVENGSFGDALHWEKKSFLMAEYRYQLCQKIEADIEGIFEDCSETGKSVMKSLKDYWGVQSRRITNKVLEKSQRASQLSYEELVELEVLADFLEEWAARPTLANFFKPLAMNYAGFVAGEMLAEMEFQLSHD